MEVFVVVDAAHFWSDGRWRYTWQFLEVLRRRAQGRSRFRELLKYVRARCWSKLMWIIVVLTSRSAGAPTVLWWPEKPEYKRSKRNVSPEDTQHAGGCYHRKFKEAEESVYICRPASVPSGLIFVVELPMVTQIIMRGKWYDLGLYNCNWFRPPFRGSSHKMRNGWNPNPSA
jgi:hypothetical protein